MNMLKRVRGWFLGPWEPDMSAVEGECARLQHDAYQVGYAQGHAVGFIAGQNAAFENLTRAVAERSPYAEAEQADIERAKKGMVH